MDTTQAYIAAVVEQFDFMVAEYRDECENMTPEARYHARGVMHGLLRALKLMDPVPDTEVWTMTDTINGLPR